MWCRLPKHVRNLLPKHARNMDARRRERLAPAVARLLSLIGQLPISISSMIEAGIPVDEKLAAKAIKAGSSAFDRFPAEDAKQVAAMRAVREEGVLRLLDRLTSTGAADAAADDIEALSDIIMASQVIGSLIAHPTKNKLRTTAANNSEFKARQTANQQERRKIVADEASRLGKSYKRPNSIATAILDRVNNRLIKAGMPIVGQSAIREDVKAIQKLHART